MNQPPVILVVWMWVGIVGAGIFVLGLVVWIVGLILAAVLPPTPPSSSE